MLPATATICSIALVVAEVAVVVAAAALVATAVLLLLLTLPPSLPQTQFLGPFLGGLALQNLPQVREIRCEKSHPYFCKSGFRSSITMYAGLCLLVACLFLLLVPHAPVAPPPPHATKSVSFVEEGKRKEEGEVRAAGGVVVDPQKQ